MTQSSPVTSNIKPTAGEDRARAQAVVEAAKVYVESVGNLFGETAAEFAPPARIEDTAESAPADRTPSDYAIEFGEYLAQAAEHMLQVFGEAPDGEDDEHSDAQRDARGDAFSGLGSAVHEFRKRAARVSASSSAERST